MSSTNLPGSFDDVVVNVRIAAPPEAVFRYFSDPARFQAWIGPGSSLHPGMGGRLTIASAMGPPAHGSIVGWQANNRVVFTWGHAASSGGLPPDSSQVEVLLEEVQGSTLVTLRHRGLPSPEQRQGSAMGWRYHLGTLSLHAHAAALEGRLEATMEAWFRAWNETDPSARAAWIGRSFASEGTLRDRYGLVQGREHLSAVIAMAQVLSKGARLERDGPAQLSHAFARAPWKMLSPAGAEVAKGTNFFELDADARIRAAVGFWDAATSG